MRFIGAGIIVFLLVCVSTAMKVNHDKNEDRFIVTSLAHVIQADEGKKISVVLSDVTVHAGAKFKLEDGDEKTWIYQSTGGGNFSVYDRYNAADVTNVTVPIKILTETNTLTIKPRRFATGDQINVRYLADDFRPGCLVSKLDGEGGTRSCDYSDDPLYPTASSCDIRKVCPSNRHQESTTMRCDGVNWLGMVGCKPILSIVHERCEIDLDQEELALSTGDCPYPVDDVVDSLIEEELSESEGDVGRSKGRRACAGWCRCNRRWKPLIKCILCRKRMCRGRTYLG